jgi:hypothetical protein
MYTDLMKFSNTRTGQKLGRFKVKANNTAEKNPHCSEDYKTWQWHAKHEFKYSGNSKKYQHWGINTGSGSRIVQHRSGVQVTVEDKFSLLWFDREETISYIPGIREFKKAQEVCRLQYTGWFTRDDDAETVCGIVGVFRWGKFVHVLPGTFYSDSESHSFNLLKGDKIAACEAYDDTGEKTEELERLMRENARYADQMAERQAEKDREEDTKYRAEEMAEQLAGVVTETRKSVRTLIKDIRGVNGSINFPPEVCAVLRGEIRKRLRTISECRDAIERVKQDPSEYDKFYKLV